MEQITASLANEWAMEDGTLGFSLSRGTSPIVMHVPHSGLLLPASMLEGSVSRINLVDEATLMCDSSTDLVARWVAEKLSVLGASPSIAVSHISRILVDLERFNSDEEEMNAVGMGVIYENAHDLTPLYDTPPNQSANKRRIEMYDAYTRAVAKECERVLGEHGCLTFLDLHSYAVHPLPYELHGKDRRPKLCFGVNDERCQETAERIALAFPEIVGINEPFSGSYCPLPLYGDERVSAYMLEIRKDSYDWKTGTPDEAVAKAIATLLDCISSGNPLFY